MKRIMVVMLLIFGWLNMSAQDPDVPEQVRQDPRAQEKINQLRIAYLSERLELTPAQAERFWPIYREFSQERMKLRNEVRDFQRSIDPAKPDPKKEQELVELGLKTRQREVDLEKDYSTRLLKVITAQQLLNLRSGEREFVDILRNQIQQRRMNQQRKENFRDRNQRLPQRN